MNPRGKLGGWWDEYFPMEFKENLGALMWKMNEIAAGRQRYSEEQERKFNETIPQDFRDDIVLVKNELAKVFLTGKLDWLVRR